MVLLALMPWSALKRLLLPTSLPTVPSSGTSRRGRNKLLLVNALVDGRAHLESSEMRDGSVSNCLRSLGGEFKCGGELGGEVYETACKGVTLGDGRGERGGECNDDLRPSRRSRIELLGIVVPGRSAEGGDVGGDEGDLRASRWDTSLSVVPVKLPR